MPTPYDPLKDAVEGDEGGFIVSILLALLFSLLQRRKMTSSAGLVRFRRSGLVNTALFFIVHSPSKRASGLQNTRERRTHDKRDHHRGRPASSDLDRERRAGAETRCRSYWRGPGRSRRGCEACRDCGQQDRCTTRDAQATGDLKFFNRRYHQYRVEAH